MQKYRNNKINSKGGDGKPKQEPGNTAMGHNKMVNHHRLKNILYYISKANMQTNQESYVYLPVENCWMPLLWNPVVFVTGLSWDRAMGGVGGQDLHGSISGNTAFMFPQKREIQVDGLSFGVQAKNLENQAPQVQNQNISCYQFKKQPNTPTPKNQQRAPPQRAAGQPAPAESIPQPSSFISENEIGKTNWSPEQEQRLKQMVNLFGKRWKYISQHFPNRTGKQIRQRYLNYLRPNLSLKKWTHEEDEEILKLVAKFGRSWRAIEKKIKNRSQNQIKNRYYGHLQKSEKLAATCALALPAKPDIKTATQIQLPQNESPEEQQASVSPSSALQPHQQH